VTAQWDIRREEKGDEASIENLVRQGFGAGRFAKTAYRLREGVLAVDRLSFVAVDSATKTLLASVRFWPIAVGTSRSLLLGPLAVAPDLRGRGIGISLMQRGIDEARAGNFETIILVGDEPYYAKVGFARLKPQQIVFPGPVDPSRVLGLALKPGALEKLSGPVMRAGIDDPVSAQAAPLG
jgi:predicted N-acetyltransferase YhbS